jgi:hypothetical protein
MPRRRPWYLRLLSGFAAVARGILWSILLAIAFAAGGAYVLTQNVFAPDKLTPILAGELQSLVHRTVRIDSARLVPLQGIRVSGLHVLEREGFGGSEFLSCSAFVAKPDWFALARGKLVVKKVLLYSPTLEIVRSSASVWNVSDLLHGGRTPVEAIQQAEIQDGTVVIRDDLEGTLHEASGVHFNLEVPAWRRIVPFTMGFDFKQTREDRVLNGRFDAEGWLDGAGGPPSDVTLNLSKMRAEFAGIEVSAKGKLKDLTQPTLDVEWETGPLQPAALASLWPTLGRARLPPLSGSLSVTLTGRKKLEVRSLRVTAGSLVALGNGRFDFSVEPPALRVRLSTERGRLEEAVRMWPPLAPFGLRGEAQANLTVNGTVGDVSLDRVGLSLRQANGHWTDVKLSDVALEFTGERNLESARLKVDDGGVFHAGQQLDGVAGVAKLESSELTIDRFSTRWNGFPITARARIVEPVAPKLIVIEGTMARLQLEQLIDWIQKLIERGEKKKTPVNPNRLAQLGWLHLFKKALPWEFPTLQGQINAVDLAHANVVGKDLSLTYDLQGVTKGLKELRGQLILDVRNGKVIDLPALDKIIFLRYVFLPFMTVHKLNEMGFMKQQNQKELPFERIHGNYRFSNGAMLIDHFFVQGPEITATAEGEVDWAQERLLLHVVTRINKTGMGAPESLSDEKGRPTLAFFVEGPMLSPDVKLDLKKVKAQEIEKFEEAGLAEGAARAEKLKKEMW